jgi:hypothetical protein
MGASMIKYVAVVSGLVSMAPLVLSGCEQDECDYVAECSGDTLLVCGRMSEDSPKRSIQRVPCPAETHCVVSHSVGAFCALDSKPDPRCAVLETATPQEPDATAEELHSKLGGYCDDAKNIVHCSAEFRGEIVACPQGEECVTSGTWALCRAVPPSRLVCGSETCDGPMATGSGIDDCCTTDQRCGGDLSPFQGLLGLPSDRLCVQRHQPGTLDDSCPGECLWKGSPSFPGCRRPDGKCGILADQASLVTLSLGCIDPRDFGTAPRSAPCNATSADAGPGNADIDGGAKADSGFP